MKSFILSTVLFSLCTCTVKAQVLNGSVSGESALTYPNGALAFNVKEATIGFNFVNFGDSSSYNSGWIYGVKATTKNTEGVAALFERGEWVPESKGKILLGYSWTCGLSKQGTLLGAISSQLLKTDSIFLSDLKKFVADQDTAKVVQEIATSLGKIPYSKLYEKINTALGTNITGKAKAALSMLKDSIPIKVSQHNLEKENLNAEFNRLADAVAKSNKWSKRLLLYAEGGVSVMSFKRYQLIDNDNLSKNFSTEQFNGGNIKIGFNLQLGGSWLLGAAWGVQASNTFENLSKKEYTIKNNIALPMQPELIVEKKLTAYSGEYNTFQQNYLLLDAVYFKKLSKGIICGINPYYKTWLSDNTETYPNTQDLGINFLFFKSSGVFSGGFYAEVKDIKDNLEKLKDEPELKKPYNRLNIGIRANINIGSIPAYSN